MRISTASLGFGLIEFILAIGVFAIVAMAVPGLIVGQLRTSANLHRHMGAILVAESYGELLLGGAQGIDSGAVFDSALNRRVVRTSYDHGGITVYEYVNATPTATDYVVSTNWTTVQLANSQLINKIEVEVTWRENDADKKITTQIYR